MIPSNQVLHLADLLFAIFSFVRHGRTGKNCAHLEIQKLLKFWDTLLCMRCHILHAVSMTPHVPCIRCQLHLTSCIVHAVSLTPLALFIFFQSKAVSPINFTFRSCSKISICMWCHCHIENFEFLREFKFICTKALDP
jgi:hypothetical protein